MFREGEGKKEKGQKEREILDHACRLNCHSKRRGRSSGARSDGPYDRTQTCRSARLSIYQMVYSDCRRLLRNVENAVHCVQGIQRTPPVSRAKLKFGSLGAGIYRSPLMTEKNKV